MFVKLHYTIDKPITHIIQSFNEIINNTAITNTATLESAAATWNATVKNGLDYTNSEIIRTVQPTTVKSQLGKNISNIVYKWTLEFQVHDAASRKYYIQFDRVFTLSATTFIVADTILSGSMTANNASIGVDLEIANNTSGVPVFLQNNAPSSGYNTHVSEQIFSSSNPTNYLNLRTAWMYLTNDCVIFAFTHAVSTTTGFGTTYQNSGNFTGPYIFSQYTRYDYHDSNANGIIPLLFSNTSGRTNKSAGFGNGLTTSADWGRVETVNSNAFRVFNLVDAHPIVGSPDTKQFFEFVQWGSGFRDSGTAALNGGVVNALGGTIGRLIHTSTGIRVPSADLQSTSYGMLPLRWSNSYRGCRGGTARGGIYIFNGDYGPGDTFSYGGKVYMVWPTWSGSSERVGIAIPME